MAIIVTHSSAHLSTRVQCAQPKMFMLYVIARTMLDGPPTVKI